ncbi:Phr protein [Mycobacteroides abscessus]|uniref:Deoxyribodipyrimidine photo-lyase n=3 Tax=Mycobacteroides abscessus TaxID=36809 RepID=A0A829HRC9_9MYCO|nr:deoxyribodipyrimidine photo-lyase [Mycobacteroides abscessus]ESV57125.1 FAD binding domain of DNA photolyase family protein [Mycobacteroides abscessus MAB_082312_2258]ESV65513.1 FAD binding domain of DNA photolyase family protein [Mycobacteroides abscessus MAB_091912_2446]AIC71285.1 deoxyribodipyrimidine photo-lyase [Mycobacteroides abscessus subsp. massiliense str. GO 06]AMU27972.1 deoxyribodipyrimidine photolyase [Mycobacteroides abscessus]AMU32728.1 deoxyribodipyrimidine photolyase [Myco
MSVIWWARRDLRLADNPALRAAAESGDVLAVFILDPQLLGSAPRPRDAWLAANVLDLDRQLDGRLCLKSGAPGQVLVELAECIGATEVHVARETTPFGRRRDTSVSAELAKIGVDWIETGSPYAVTPGRITKSDGSTYRVFTAFERAWRAHHWPRPAQLQTSPSWVKPPASAPLSPARSSLAGLVQRCGIALPPAGEGAARTRWEHFLAHDLTGYAAGRDRADVDATSRISPYLKVGAIHPRTLLADLAAIAGQDAAKFISELAWRDFYADVLFHQPRSAHTDLTDALAHLTYAEPGEGFRAWQRGETGYPLVDAGMRQLLAEGWMHNRVRMVTASFLTKDLHIWWPHGARHFMNHLIDADSASNTHGWQWVAGTGTDAAPYFRVFNPTAQAQKFDPNGDYIRKYIPELRHLSGASAITPWKCPDGHTRGYPTTIVDHAEERNIALHRYQSRQDH